MNYIVNPWIIYLIDIADNIHVLTVISLLFSIAALLFIIPVFIDDGYLKECYEELAKKVRNVSLPIFIFSLALMVFFPSSKTITKMVVASYVTEENVDKAKEQVVEIVDYIFEKVDEVNDENN